MTAQEDDYSNHTESESGSTWNPSLTSDVPEPAGPPLFDEAEMAKLMAEIDAMSQISGTTAAVPSTVPAASVPVSQVVQCSLEVDETGEPLLCIHEVRFCIDSTNRMGTDASVSRQPASESSEPAGRPLLDDAQLAELWVEQDLTSQISGTVVADTLASSRPFLPPKVVRCSAFDTNAGEPVLLIFQGKDEWTSTSS